MTASKHARIETNRQTARLKHDPENVGTDFPKRSCSNKGWSEMTLCRKAISPWSAATGGKHAVQLARNPGPGSHDGDGAEGIPCRPSSRARAQSRAAVRLHCRAGQL